MGAEIPEAVLQETCECQKCVREREIGGLKRILLHGTKDGKMCRYVIPVYKDNTLSSYGACNVELCNLRCVLKEEKEKQKIRERYGVEIHRIDRRYCGGAENCRNFKARPRWNFGWRSWWEPKDSLLFLPHPDADFVY